jgi:hypothetical protein
VTVTLSRKNVNETSPEAVKKSGLFMSPRSDCGETDLALAGLLPHAAASDSRFSSHRH